MATHSTILAWEIPWKEEAGELHGVLKSQTTERLSMHTHTCMTQNTGFPEHSYLHGEKKVSYFLKNDRVFPLDLNMTKKTMRVVCV